MPFSLPSDHVLLNREFDSKRDVIQVIGDVMVRSADVNPAYARAMFEKEDQYSTWVTDGVALPHGTNQAKKEVLRNSIVFVQIPKGVDWGDGKTVHLAIGLAGTGDEQHLQLLAELAGVLQRPENIERLRSSTSNEEVVGILTAGDGQEVE
jgi:mannitol/fructose-specific phosphotransferase system IIA component